MGRDKLSGAFPYVTASDGYYRDGGFICHNRHALREARTGAWLDINDGLAASGTPTGSLSTDGLVTGSAADSACVNES